MTLQPVTRTSLSDSVFQQLSNEIVHGRFQSGRPLPSERALCEMLRVNRGAVREAVKRLEQAGLVSSQHGAGNHVLDFRKTAGLDLLPHLLLRGDGDIDFGVVRSVMELRSALAPDVARLCAERDPQRAGRLQELVHAMTAAGDDLGELQTLALAFWDELVDGSGNIAYRLALNSMRRIYEPVREAMAEVLAAELLAIDHCRDLALAVSRGQGEQAATLARELIAKGMQAALAAIAALQDDPDGTEPPESQPENPAGDHP